jgi:hypothetical protein
MTVVNHRFIIRAGVKAVMPGIHLLTWFLVVPFPAGEPDD